METIKHCWGIRVQDIGYVYEGLHWNFAHYVGGGRRYTDLTKEPYLRDKVKVI